MNKKIKVLLLEDNTEDAELNILELKKGGFDITSERVDVREDFINALTDFNPDIILADYSLPGFGGFEALEILKNNEKKIPFIFVSGTLGEDRAVESIKQGATDYVLKQNLKRLASSVKRALKEFEEIEKREIAEKSLKESEENFRIIFETAPNLIFILNKEKKIVICNDRIRQYLGYDYNEVLGRSFLEFIHPDNHEDAMETFKEIYSKGFIYNKECRLICKDGSAIYINVNSSIYKTDDIKGIYTICIIDNITERKQSEEALRESESSLRYAQVISKMGSWEWDIVTQKNNWSDNYFAIYGFKPFEIEPGLEFFKKRIHPEDIHFFDETYAEIMNKKKSSSFDLRITQPDGTFKWIQNNVLPIIENDKIVKLKGIIIDITERKHAEIALRESEKKFYSVFHQSPVGSAIVGMDKRFIMCNSALCKFLGYSENELTGKTIEYITFPEDVNLGMPQMKQMINREIETFTIEKRYLTKDGKIVWGLNSYCLIFDADQKPIYFLPVIQDITQSKQMETQLREKEYVLSQSQRLGHIGSWGWDLKGPNIWTDEMYNVYGVTPETFIPTFESLINLIHPDDRQAMQQWFESCMAGKSPVALEFRTILPDGSIRFISGHGDLLSDNDGKPIFMGGTAQDITEKKISENSLRDSEEKFRKAFELSNVGKILTAPDGIIININEEFCKMLQFSRNELLQIHFNKIIHTEDIEMYNNCTRCLLNGETSSCRLDIRYIKKDGSTLWTDVSLILIRSTDDKPVHFMTHVIDITERRQMIEEIKFKNAILTTQQEVSIDAIFAVDEKGKIFSYNKRFINLMDIHKDIIDSHSDDLAIKSVLNKFSNPEQILKKVNYLFEQHNATGFEEINMKDGRILERYSAPMIGNEGKYYGRIWFFRDISERKKAEEEIKKLNETLEQRVIERTSRLEALNKELEAFSYSVSHDLRAPLRAIDGFSKFLSEDYGTKLDDEGKRLLNVIRANTRRMDQLIADMLSLSKITRSEFNYSIIDMNTLANSIYNEVTTDVIRLEFEFKVLSLPDAFGDANLIRQVWVNLLTNAVKYTMKSDVKKIEVGFMVENCENVYYVRDTGAGFNPEYTHKLFGVFQRLHKTEEFEGTGIGLAIVQRIIIRHGGKVRAEGKVNEGATFYFSLPVKELSK
jgi:PAS domain S-box-containing protein